MPTEVGFHDSHLQGLLEKAISGELADQGSQFELLALKAHVKTCGICRETLIERAHQQFTLPLIRRLAKEMRFHDGN
jgi:hypothetical protein